MRRRAAVGLAAVSVMCALGVVAVAAVAAAPHPPPDAAPLDAAPLDAAPARHAVIVVAGGLPWSALGDAGLAGLQWWLERGAVAAMNAQAAGREAADAWLTIGAGSRATATAWGGDAYETDERLAEGDAAALYSRNTGSTTAGAGAVHLGIEAIRGKAAAENHLVVPGALAEELRRAGLLAAALGNADLPGEPRRYAALVAMDGAGRLPWAFIGREAAVADAAAPGGLRTDWDAVERAFAQAWARASLIVVDEGDLGRLAAAPPLLSPDAAGAATLRALTGLDRFLGFAATMVDPARDLFILASAVPAAGDAVRGEGLAPLVAAGPGIPAGGALSSATTRRRGLAANLDLAPTVLRHFGRDAPVGMYGAPLHGMAAADAVGEAQALRRGALAAQAQRLPLIRGYITAEVVALLAAAWLIVAPRAAAGALAAARWALLGLTAVPLALLLLPTLGALSPPVAAAAAVALTAAIVAASHGPAAILARVAGREAGTPPFAPFAVVALATLAAVAVDALSGGHLAPASPLGYSFISGARYYGVGNEYAGATIGAAVFAAAALVEWARARPAAATAVAATLGAAVTLLLGAPGVGANMGAALASTVGFGYLAWRASGRRFSGRAAVALLAAAAAMLLLIAALDGLGAAPPSHVGRALADARRGGAGLLVQTVARKVALNIRLVRYTIWSRVLLVTLLTFAVSLYRPVGLLRHALARYPALRLGLEGVAAASVAALICNDSGVVAAACALIYASAPLAAVLLAERAAGRAGRPASPASGGARGGAGP